MKTQILLTNRDGSETTAYALCPAAQITQLIRTVDDRFYVLTGYVGNKSQYTEVDFDECTVVFTDDDFIILKESGEIT